MFLVVLLLHTEHAEDPLCLVLFQVKAAQCTGRVTDSSRNGVVQSCSKYLKTWVSEAFGKGKVTP